MLNPSSYTGSRSFRPQSEAFLIAIEKSIHFFFNYICDFAYRTLKQFGFFDNRKAYLMVAMTMEDFTHDIFCVMPKRGFRRQNIIHTTYGLDYFGHAVLLYFCSPISCVMGFMIYSVLSFSS